MSDDQVTNPPPEQVPPVHHGILDKTFGEIIENNQQAQGIIMKTMHIDQQKLQEMIHATGSNDLMHMTIRDMFKNGIMQQAASGQTIQVTPEQMQQINEAMQNNEGQLTAEQLQQITGIDTSQAQEAQAVQQQPQQQSFIQKLKGLFG